MKEYLKYASYIIVSGTIAYVCLTLRTCDTAGDSPGRVVIPRDTAYLPVTYRDYTPKSTPFEKPVKPVSKLPNGIKESDVKRIVTVRNMATGGTMTIIETRSDEVLVPKGNDSLQVTVVNYLPPVIRFGIFPGIGLTLNAGASVSPSASVAFIRINEKILAPVFSADLHSVGIGIGYQFYHDITITPLLMWNYSDTERTIKLNVSYAL